MRGHRILIITGLLVLATGITRCACADNAFFRVLAAKPNATMEDAVKALYMLKLGESALGEMTFAEICDILTQKQLIKKDYAKDPKRLVNRGQIAYMICKALEIKGGLTMRIFGVSERYGYRECVYLGLLPVGSQWDKVSGSELLGILAQAADYQEAHKRKE